MIRNPLHKGLRNFYATGSLGGVQPDQQKRLRMILVRLEASHKPEDMNLPGFKFHKLQGGVMKDYYSVSVNKNYRVIFKFEGDHACDIDYIDYH